MEQKLYRIPHLPCEFSPIATAAFHSLDGSLYALGGQLVFTDEAEDIAQPRNQFGSYEELEDWLVRCACDWLAEGKNDPMAQELAAHLRTVS